MTTQTKTPLMMRLAAPKPTLFVDGDNPVATWSRTWVVVMYELPTMWKRKEEWVYFNWGAKQVMAGTDSQIQAEFQSLLRQGLKKADDSEVNGQGIYCVLPHPKKKKMGLRCEFSFERFYKEGEARLCPLLWGVGVMGDGYTYIRVRFSEVEPPKGELAVGLRLINGKFTME
jgi:hypothetical protein